MLALFSTKKKNASRAPVRMKNTPHYKKTEITLKADKKLAAKMEGGGAGPPLSVRFIFICG